MTPRRPPCVVVGFIDDFSVSVNNFCGWRGVFYASQPGPINSSASGVTVSAALSHHSDSDSGASLINLAKSLLPFHCH